MIAAALTITAADGLPEGATIAVEVEHDDGYVSFATVRLGHQLIRCYANTADRRVQWEVRGADLQWYRATAEAVGLPEDLRKAMARAAHAGLVASGARSVS